MAEDEITTILLVRHADVHNPGDVVYGRLPRFGLSVTGREEAERTAQHLRSEPLSAIYSSPQLRARQTARAIAAEHRSLRVSVTQSLAEVRTSWQGTPSVEMAARRYNFYDPQGHPADETLDQIAARIMRWIAAMLSRHAGQEIVGVSHGDPIMLARVLLTGGTPSVAALRARGIYPHKGSVTRLAFTGTGDPMKLPVQVILEDPNLEARAGSGADTPWASAHRSSAH
ncbi:MAG: histidine phosphatase family protein [Candidatus Dormibacteraeota bacterium]|nr:histidine phosphatase family protein [Candidatus Dormibacteraeota bacterium]